MTGQTIFKLTGLGITALMLAACTASPYVPEKKFAEASEARLVVVTGSRIAQMVDINERNPRTATPTSIITIEDIERTGEMSLCRALKRMMPNMVGRAPGQPKTAADIANQLRC